MGQIIQVEEGPPLFTMRATESRELFFDWFAMTLSAGVNIVSSTFSVSAIKPSKTDVALVLDSENSPSNGSVRLTGGTPGQLYEVVNIIETDEAPTQTLDSRARILVDS
jgi:hypothetical protein